MFRGRGGGRSSWIGAPGLNRRVHMPCSRANPPTYEDGHLVAVSEAAAWQPVSGSTGEIQIGASLNWAGACLGVGVSRPLVGSRFVDCGWSQRDGARWRLAVSSLRGPTRTNSFNPLPLEPGPLLTLSPNRATGSLQI